MKLEKAIKLLREMQDNCKTKKTYKDDKAEAKAEAIEVVLKELEESKDTDIKLYKKLNMQERVIDEMAEDIYDYELAILEDNQRGYGFDNIEEVKQYFYKKVEEQE